MTRDRGWGVVDIADTRMALERAADRVVRLAATAPDAEVAVPDSDWTVRDVLVHLALGAEAYLTYVNGATEPFVDVSDVAGGSLARSSAAKLAADPERDLLALTTLSVPRWRRSSMPLPVVTATTRSCGMRCRSNSVPCWPWDWASTCSTGWISLGRSHSRGGSNRRMHASFAAAMPLLPLLVNPATTAGVRVAYDLRIRGGERFMVRIDDGALAVGRSDGGVDCHVSAEPASLLLVAYGRRSQWIPVLTGKLTAWGRKPWAGLRLTHYIVTP